MASDVITQTLTEVMLGYNQGDKAALCVPRSGLATGSEMSTAMLLEGGILISVVLQIRRRFVTP